MSFLALLAFYVLANSQLSYASPSYLTYSAKIIKPDGNPLEATVVDFKFTVQNPAGTCNLYSETFTSVNMSGSQGLVVITLGLGTRNYPAAGATKLVDVFDNTQVYACETAGTYTATPTAARLIVMQFNDGGGWQTIPAMQVNSVPYASYAHKAQTADLATNAINAVSATTAANALTLNGYADASFVLKPSIPTCGGGTALTYNGAVFSCVASSSASGTVTSVSSSNSYLTITNSTSAATITANVGMTANTLAAGNDTRITGALQASNNLSDVVSSATVRTNLGLGETGVTAGTYGSGNAVPSFTIDSLGRVMSVATNSYQYATSVDYGIVRISPSSNLTIIGGDLSLSASNVVNALGFTPAVSGSGVTSLDGLNDAVSNLGTGTLYLGPNAGVNSTASAAAHNTGLGVRALNMATSTSSNQTAVGYNALESSNSATGNTAVGADSLANSTQSYNTSVGASTMKLLTTGANNTAIGQGAGYFVTSGSGNLFLGNASGPSSSGSFSNKLYISNSVGVPLVYGDFLNRKIGIGTDLLASASLTVSGSIVSNGNRILTGSVVDLSIANSHLLDDLGGSVISLTNLSHGGEYTLIVRDPTSREYIFTGCNSVKFFPVSSATISSTDTIYEIKTFNISGSWICYINWSTGYQ